MRHQQEALANGEKEVRGNRETRLEVLEDEGLVLQLVPLCRRERRPHRRRIRRRNAHGVLFLFYAEEGKRKRVMNLKDKEVLEVKV